MFQFVTFISCDILFINKALKVNANITVYLLKIYVNERTHRYNELPANYAYIFPGNYQVMAFSR